MSRNFFPYYRFNNRFNKQPYNRFNNFNNQQFNRFNNHPFRSNFNNNRYNNVRNNANFVNPTIKSKKRGRGGYRINNITSSLSLPITVCIMLVGFTFCTALNYNICDKPISFQLFAPPLHTECNIPEITERVLETEVTLFVPVAVCDEN